MDRNLSAAKSTTLFAVLWILLGCDLSQQQIDRRSKSQVKSKAFTADNNQCLKIKDGDLLSTKDVITYKNSGFVLSLDSGGNLESICSGYLIKPDVVLTAQHCIADANQVAKTAERVLFTFLDLPVIVQRVTDRQPWEKSDVKKIVQWAEEGQPYRDVALLQLDKPFDETHPPFDLIQNEIPTANTKIQMVGYGNYAQEGVPKGNVSQGVRRIGTGEFAGYQDEPFPEFSNPKFLRDADYLNLRPLASSKNQMICQGDSGSSIFWNQGHGSVIVGVTSMQVIANRQEDFDAWDDCVNSSAGLFVPAHRIRNWVNREITKMDASYALRRYSSFKGRIKAIKEGKTSNTLTVELIRHMDNGLNLAAKSFDMELCHTNCERYPIITNEIKKDATLNFRVEKPDSKILLVQASGTIDKLDYLVEFEAMISSVAKDEKIVNGRTERSYTFRYVQPLAGMDVPPMVTNDILHGVHCSDGCGFPTKVLTSGFTPSISKGVKVKGQVIQGKLYLREINQNKSFDLEEINRKKSAPQMVQQPINQLPNVCK